MWGKTGSGRWGAVQGDNSGSGPRVQGQSANAAGVYGESDNNDRGAVEGSNTGTGGYGVWGNSNGIGVYGSGQQNGVKGTSSTTESARRKLRVGIEAAYDLSSPRLDLAGLRIPAAVEVHTGVGISGTEHEAHAVMAAGLVSCQHVLEGTPGR